MTKLKNTAADEYLLSLFSAHNRIYLGDELKEKLVSNLGKRPDAARKIVERFAAKGLVHSSKPVSFGKGTYAYYAINKKITFEDLIGITRTRRPPLFRLLSAIKKCNGVLSYYEALKISGSPLAESRTKANSLDTLITELKSFDVINMPPDKNNNRYLIANYIKPDETQALINRHYSLMLVDAILIKDILDTLSKLNLIDSRYVYYRKRKAPTIGRIHNNFVWDAYSYTKTTGLTPNYRDKSTEGIKQAMVVLEIVISRKFELFDFDGFYNRVQVLLNHTAYGRKIIPIIVYREISSEALSKARTLGWLTYELAAFFGHRINEVIHNIIAVKLSENTAQDKTIDPIITIENSMEVIEESGNLPNLPNVIGDFFQSLIYQLLNYLYPNCTIEQNKIYRPMDDIDEKVEYYEYDFIIYSYRTNEIIAVELKGTTRNSAVKIGGYKIKNTLKWFFNRTLPSFVRHFEKGVDQHRNVRACFITSGKYEPDGQAFLNELNKGKLKPSDLNLFYDGKTLMSLANQNSLETLKKILSRYFVKMDG